MENVTVALIIGTVLEREIKTPTLSSKEKRVTPGQRKGVFLFRINWIICLVNHFLWVASNPVMFRNGGNEP